MCVIIITNPAAPISENELHAAWTTNPDGAGYAYTDGEKVHFKRGFMNFKKFNKEVQELQTQQELMLHLRISTGAGITPINTHPYKVGSVLTMNTQTPLPVVCMNGVIYGQKLKTKRGHNLNDTASYIIQYAEAFKVINPDIINIIAEATGAKWAATTPAGIINSSDFITREGRKYSNLNHLSSYMINWDDQDDTTPAAAIELEHLIHDQDLLYKVYNDWELLDDLEDYIDLNCRHMNCRHCAHCISEAKTIKDLRVIHEQNVYNWIL